MKNTLLATLVVVLGGCASGPPTYYRYTGPTNKTQQDFLTDRYQCIKEAQQRVSSAYVNQYGGSSNSSVKPSCAVYNGCMASKGYFRNDTTDPNVFNQPGNFYIDPKITFSCTN